MNGSNNYQLTYRCRRCHEEFNQNIMGGYERLSSIINKIEDPCGTDKEYKKMKTVIYHCGEDSFSKGGIADLVGFDLIEGENSSKE